MDTASDKALQRFAELMIEKKSRWKTTGKSLGSG